MYTYLVPKQYSIAHARAHLPAIVNEAAAGDDIELTRRGKPVAVVISRQRYSRLSSTRPHFSDAYRAFREHFAASDLPESFDVERDPSGGRAVDL